jgi:hypothetical protein
VSALDRAAQDGVIHKNAAARGKSRLLKRFNLAQASAVANAASAPAAEKPATTRKAPASKPAASRAKAAPKASADKPAPRTSRTRKA